MVPGSYAARAVRGNCAPAWIVAVALVGLCVSGAGHGGWFAGTAPNDLGASGGRLKPCPDTPNCVHSQGEGARRVEPLAYDDTADRALDRLKHVLSAIARMVIVEERSDYLRLEASSRVFGFVDDVEFLLDPNARLIHVRSASRLGYSDLGANRQRIEAIRAAFAAAPASK